MRFLGLDFGSKTIGVSVSDKTNIIASSLVLLKYDDINKVLNDIEKLINQYKITHIVLGYPKNMNDTLNERTEKTLEFKKKLENLNVEVILQDERLTTREATRTLIEGDISRKKRKNLVDKVASTFILQSYLDRRNNG